VRRKELRNIESLLTLGLAGTSERGERDKEPSDSMNALWLAEERRSKGWTALLRILHVVATPLFKEGSAIAEFCFDEGSPFEEWSSAE